MAYPSKAYLVTPRNALPVGYLRSVLNYSKRTGIFRWKITLPPRGRRGMVAGCPHPDGRIFIGIHGARYVASRLAWRYVTGQWPKEVIDHENGKCSDNRWKNLRPASQMQNMRNSKKRAHSTQPYKGVKKHRRKFTARITFENQEIYLGIFPTAKQAYAAYCKAAKRLHKKFARFE